MFFDDGLTAHSLIPRDSFFLSGAQILAFFTYISKRDKDNATKSHLSGIRCICGNSRVVCDTAHFHADRQSEDNLSIHNSLASRENLIGEREKNKKQLEI